VAENSGVVSEIFSMCIITSSLRRGIKLACRGPA
jgi:hypothetical protein